MKFTKKAVWHIVQTNKNFRQMHACFSGYIMAKKWMLSIKDKNNKLIRLVVQKKCIVTFQEFKSILPLQFPFSLEKDEIWNHIKVC